MSEKSQKLILVGIILTILLVFSFIAVMVIIVIPDYAIHLFGPPDPKFDTASRIIYSTRLYLNRDFLLSSTRANGEDRLLVITSGETGSTVAENLEKVGLIKNREIFSDYLVYMGFDRLIQTGTYVLNPAMKPVDIAAVLFDGTPLDVAFSFLRGWRSEEISALLPTSGLDISEQEFLQLVKNPSKSLSDLISPETASLEGFLFPGNYQVLKQVDAAQLIEQFIINYINQLPADYSVSLKKTGLSFYQMVILASIVEKETILDEEAPIIASVFINRLNAGMPLQSDPTVQYALGYDSAQRTWWKNPLTSEDLTIASPYNTYLHSRLPPAAICNPGKNAILAVLQPAITNFLYFRSACDGSGSHSFSETYADHLKAACD